VLQRERRSEGCLPTGSSSSLGRAVERLDAASDRFLARELPAGRAAFGQLTKNYNVGYASTAVVEAGTVQRGAVVRMEVDQVDLPSVAPVAVELLSERAAFMLSADEWARIALDIDVDELRKVRAYTDSRLRGGKSKAALQLALRMLKAGILRRTRDRKGLPLAMFTVAKRAGHQRLVFDGRCLSRCFAKPPRLDLASIEAFACLDCSGLQEGEFLDAWAGDIEVWFYSLLLPEHCWPWLTIETCAADLEEFCGESIEGTGPFLALCVPVMGWSWAPAIAQTCLEDLLATCPNVELQAGNRLCRSSLAPDLSLGLAHYSYLDDFALLGICAAANAATSHDDTKIQAAGSRLQEWMESKGLAVHKIQRELPIVALGTTFEEIDGKVRLSPDAEKLARVTAATWWLVQHPFCSGLQLACIIGHWVWMCLTARPHLSILDECYDELVARGTLGVRSTRKLPQAVLNELAALAALAPMLGSDLSAPWAAEIACVDAGPEGGGVVYAGVTAQAARDIGRFGERSGWSVHAARAADDDTTAGKCIRPPSVGLDVMCRPWRLALCVPWKVTEHQNVQEATTVLLALLRAARCGRFEGHRYVVLTDSLVAMGALAKGRSSSAALNRICRRVLAVLLAHAMKLYMRHVPSWINTGDAPSRLVRNPGVLTETVVKAVQKHRRRGWALPPSLEFVASLVSRNPVCIQLPVIAPVLERSARRSQSGAAHFGKEFSSDEAGDGPSLPWLLEQAVKPSTAATYRRELRKFVRWAVDQRRRQHGERVSTIAELDNIAVVYLSDMAQSGRSSSAGGQFVSAITHFMPEAKGNLPLLGRGLAAFYRINPSKEGEGFSEEIWGLLMYEFWLALGEEGVAVLCLLVDCLLSGDEFDRLLVRDVTSASVSGVLTCSIYLPSTKTGVNQGVSVQRNWVSAMIGELRGRRLRSHGQHARLFSFSRGDFSSVWARACSKLGLHRTPHATRHAGATLLACGARINGQQVIHSLDAIKGRGRWSNLKSVRRYSKPHVLPRLNAGFSTASLAWGRSAVAALDARGWSLRGRDLANIFARAPPLP